MRRVTTEEFVCSRYKISKLLRELADGFQGEDEMKLSIGEKEATLVSIAEARVYFTGDSDTRRLTVEFQWEASDESTHKAVCANCGKEFQSYPIKRKGKEYCCAGCARGMECICSRSILGQPLPFPEQTKRG